MKLFTKRNWGFTLAFVLILAILTPVVTPIFTSAESPAPEQSLGLATDAQAYVEQLVAAEDPIPLRRVLHVGTDYEPIDLITTELLSSLPCQSDGNSCDVFKDCTKDDIHTVFTENSTYLDVAFDSVPSGTGSCIRAKFTPTAAAKAAVLPAVVKGYFIFEKTTGGITHRSRSILFELTLINNDNEGYELAAAVDNYVATWVGGTTPAVMKRYLDIDGSHDYANLISAGLMPYIPCNVGHGTCGTAFSVGDINFDFTENGTFLAVSTEYFTVGWNRIIAKFVPTAAASAASLPAAVKGSFNFKKTAAGVEHKSFDISFEFVLYSKQAAKLSFTAEVEQYINKLRSEPVPNPLQRKIYIDKENGPIDLLSTGLIPYIPCLTNGDSCSAISQCTSNDIKVAFTENAGLLNITFGHAEYSDWSSVQVDIDPTGAGKAITLPTIVKGYFYFEKTVDGNIHRTKGLAFAFTLDSQANSVISVTDDFAAEVQSYADRLVEGATPSPIRRAFNVNKEYSGNLISTGLIPFLPCRTDGNNCSAIKQCTKNDIRVAFTENADMLNITFGYAEYGDWNSVLVYIKPTAAARNAKLPATVRGCFYFETTVNSVVHQSKGIEFVFTLDTKDSANPGPVLEKEDDFAVEMQAYVEQLVAGKKPAPLKRTFNINNQYNANLISTGLIPFIPCQTDGNNCSGIKQCTQDNVRVAFTANADLLDISFGNAEYEGWNSVRVYIKPTDAAKKAPLPAVVKG